MVSEVGKGRKRMNSLTEFDAGGINSFSFAKCTGYVILLTCHISLECMLGTYMLSLQSKLATGTMGMWGKNV